MDNNAVLLNTIILTVCYLIMTIALMVATIWIYKLKLKIKDLERQNKND